MTVFISSLFCIFAVGTASAQAIDPSEFIRSEQQMEIWNTFQGAKFQAETEATLYSGACYRTEPSSKPDQAQSGLAYFYFVDGHLFYDGQFGSPDRVAAYNAMSYAEAEEQFDSHENQHRLTIANEAGFVDLSTGKSQVVYAFRHSPDRSHLYLVGLITDISAVLCDLRKHTHEAH